MKLRKFFKEVSIALVLSMLAGSMNCYASVSENLCEELEEEDVIEIASFEFSKSEGYEEGAYAVFAGVENADGYVAYVSQNPSDSASWKQLDNQLIRKYPDYYRVDALGLKEGEWYIKIDALSLNADSSVKEVLSSAVTSPLSVGHYDRSGFSFSGGKGSSGAYEESGALKDNALVVYVTNENFASVTENIYKNSTSKTDKVTGFINILNAYKNGNEKRPLDVRFIGNIKYSSAAVIVQSISVGVTLEGVGDDATLNGTGIQVKSSDNVEIRNLGIMNAAYGENDDITVDSAKHVWVHNNDLFYGASGSDSDQLKGDGALDCKKSDYVTFSYNHLWDNGKASLLGSGNSETVSYGCHVTYHHNWFDHSDERQPRTRFFTAHVYNNYFDGISKYGIGATNYCSIFAESNFFRNCKYPMLVSMQGSDIYRGGSVYDDGNGTFSKNIGGVIKAFGNRYAGYYTLIPYKCDSYVKRGKLTAYDLEGAVSGKHFDAYAAKTRDEKVPADVTYVSTGSAFDTHYNNFDTDASMYKYEVHSAGDVPAIVMEKAGRHNGGDFWWNFSDVDDDTDSGVNAALMNALKAYKGRVVSVGGINPASSKDSSGAVYNERLPRSATGNTSGYVFDDFGNSVYTAGNEAALSGNRSMYEFNAEEFIANNLKLTQASASERPLETGETTDGIYKAFNFAVPAKCLDNITLKRTTGYMTIAVPSAGVLTVHAGTDINSDTCICDVSLKNSSGTEIKECFDQKTIAQRQPSTLVYNIPAAGTYTFGYPVGGTNTHTIRVYSMSVVTGDGKYTYTNPLTKGVGDKGVPTPAVTATATSTATATATATQAAPTGTPAQSTATATATKSESTATATATKSESTATAAATATATQAAPTGTPAQSTATATSGPQGTPTATQSPAPQGEVVDEDGVLHLYSGYTLVAKEKLPDVKLYMKLPENAGRIRFRSSNKKALAVNAKGQLKAKKTSCDEVVITAYVKEGKSIRDLYRVSYSVEVPMIIKGLRLAPGAFYEQGVYLRNINKLKAKDFVAMAPQIADIDSGTGKITALGKGTAKFGFNINGVPHYVKIKVQ